MTEPASTIPVRPSEERSDAWATLASLWRALRKNWLLASAVTAATLLAATFFTLGQKKIYRSSGTIQIDPTPPRPLGNEIQSVVEMGTGAYLNNREYYETQYRIITSRRVAKAVVQELGLHRDASFIANAPPGATPLATEVSVETAAEILISRLEVEPEKQSRLVTVAFEDADPQRAQRIVTTVIERYREQNLDDVLSSTTSAVDWLKGQLSKLKGELEDNELALHDYKKKKNILSLSLDDQSNMLRGEMGKLNELLTEVRAERERQDARRKELQKVDAKDPKNIPSGELMTSPLLQRLRESYVDATQARAALAAHGKGENHPELAAATARVDTTRQALLAEVRNIKASVDREFAAITRQAGGLRRLYDAANKRALELNLMEIEYNRLRRSKDNTERLYSLVLDRTKESDLTRMMRVNNIHIVDDPRLPGRPVKPSVPANLAIGLLGGLVLGFGLALGREMLDRSVKTPDDVEKELRQTFLGLLPQLADVGAKPTYATKRRRRKVKTEPDDLGQPELIVHRYPSSGIAEAARAIRTNILFMAPDNPHRTLLVTSAAPSEGKTTVASCIAIAMAQAGQKVVLVDCDMRRPRIHRIFKNPSGGGITTAMLDLSTLDDSLIKGDVPNLEVLACGPVPPNPAELLHSEAFQRVLQTLQARFDRVVIDSPPLVPVTDAAVLSTRVDGTVVVVRAFKTSKDVARQAIRSLLDVGGRVVGVVLNGVDTTRRDYGYYYQYYYYRNEGYSVRDDHDSEHQTESPPPPPPN